MMRLGAAPVSSQPPSVEVSMLAPGTLLAPLPRRLLAFTLDAVAWALCGGAFVAIGTFQVLGADGSGELTLLMLLGAVMALGLALGQWWALGRAGWTIGRLLTGVRCVRVEDGSAPGLLGALLRQLVVGVAWCVPVIGPVLLYTSPLLDDRRRGWADKAARLVQVDVVTGIDPTTATLAPRRLDDVLRTHAPVHAASRAVPPTVPPAARGRSGAAPSASEPLTAVPWPVREGEGAPAADLLPAPTGMPGEVPAAASRPAPPVVTSLPSGVVERTAALLDLEDTGPGLAAHGRHVAEPDDSSGPGSRVPEQGGPPYDDGAPAPGSAPGDVTDTAGRPVTRIVASAPTPVHTSRSFASSPEEEDVEATRLRPARGKVPAVAEGRHEVTVSLTDGQHVTVAGTALVGRDPSPRPGEEADQLVRVADPGRSVSKTHLQLGVDRSGLWIKDRDSTNGTVVTLADGQQILCGAEQQVRLPAGATVAFGDYGLSVVLSDG